MQSKTKADTGHLISRIAQFNGMDVAAAFPAQKGYRNESHPVLLTDGRSVNIMVFKDTFDGARTIRNANEVSNYLAVNGFPARRTADSRILELSSPSNKRYAAVYNYLPGETIAWEAYTQKHIKLLGKTMSDMHHALQKYDPSGLPDVADIYLQIVQRMKRYFTLPGVRHELEAKLNLSIRPDCLDPFGTILKETKKLKNQQALHMDFVRSNILFSDTTDGLKISGILDFEKTARGHPTFDIARSLAFLLVDCKFKPADKVRKYFLHSGYQKRGKADLQHVKINNYPNQTTLLESLMDLFLLYDLYKFLRHNPYEFLYQNEHFERTVNLLQQRNVGMVVKR